MFTGTDTPDMDWLNVIHAVNRAIPGTFGEPDGMGTLTRQGVDGRFVEDYPEALVVFESTAVRDANPGSPVLVIGKTPAVDSAIDAAARLLGFTS